MKKQMLILVTFFSVMFSVMNGFAKTNENGVYEVNSSSSNYYEVEFCLGVGELPGSDAKLKTLQSLVMGVFNHYASSIGSLGYVVQMVESKCRRVGTQYFIVVRFYHADEEYVHLTLKGLVSNLGWFILDALRKDGEDIGGIVALIYWPEGREYVVV